jgi:hypothetical protein
MLVLGLVGWDRRRRFLEQHPEIVLRRRALRALRRQRRDLRRAAENHNEREFAAGAVAAMRIACAPHYPAEVRALVGKDIIEQLPRDANASRATEIVRTFFDSTDASAFAARVTATTGLLQLRQDLEKVLDSLEARL